MEVPAERVPRIPPDFLAAEPRALGDAWYRQEYGCEFMGQEGSLFDAELIRWAISYDVKPLEFDPY